MNEKKHFNVYTVSKPGGGSEENGGYWTRIGTMFPHANGRGFTMKLTAHPIGAELVILPPKTGEALEGPVDDS